MSAAPVTAPTTRTEISNRTRTVIIAALVVGAVLGLAGNFLTGAPQSILWAISAIGLIVGAVTLSVLAAPANPLAAIGYLVFAFGETRILNPTEVAIGEASFAAGAMLYAAGLTLIALSGWGRTWVRLFGLVAAVLFGAHALLFFGGAAVDSTGPLAATGYGVLTVTITGWIAAVVRDPQSAAPAPTGR